jgi:hypothetical protein
MKPDQVIKAIIALVVAILAALTTAITGKTDFGDIDTQTWLIALGTVLASGALTWFVSNIQGVAGGIMKAVVASFGASVASLVTALDDNALTREEQITALSAFVVGLSLVYQIPNAIPEELPPTATQLPAR